MDLSILNDASRGVWGAMVLLLTWREWYLAYLGAFVFLAGFIIGPTIQLTVEVRVRELELPNPVASVPICNPSHSHVTDSGGSLPLTIIGAMYEGLLQISNNNALDPFCPSGNCTFPTYQSLGFCNECVDMSDKLRFYVGVDETNAENGLPAVNSTVSLEDCGLYDHLCTVELPGYGVTLNRHGLMNTTIDDLTQNSEFRPSLTVAPPVGYLVGILRRNGKETSEPKNYSAVECSLRFCVKTYEGSVRLGRFQEKVISSSWANSTGPGTGFNNITLPADPCYVDGNRKTPPYSIEDERKCVYMVDRTDFFSMGNIFRGLLRGDAIDIVGNRPYWSSEIMPALWGLFKGDEDWFSSKSASLETVNRTMTSLADVLSNRIRGLPSICAGASVPGTQLSDQLYLHVRWEWLGLTIAVLILSLGFFVATVLQSLGETLWKSSVFAYLIGHPRVGGEELSARNMLEAAEAELKVGVRPGPVPEMLHMSCDKMVASFNAATVRFRTRGGEAE